MNPLRFQSQMLQGSDFSAHLGASPCPNIQVFLGKLHLHTHHTDPDPSQQSQIPAENTDLFNFFLSGREDKEGNDRISNSSGKKEVWGFF